MWRATVIERILDGQVVVSIPALFRGDPVGPIQSAVDAQVGDAVIVADLVPAAKVRDWWVVGYESQIGRWGSPYPHEHPIGQITSVDAAGNPTTLPAILDTKANKSDIPPEQDLSGYVTDTELSTTLAGYATDTELSTGLSGKANAPGSWVTCTPSTYITKESGADIQVRTIPGGIQLRSGRWRYASDVPRDSTIFTIPSGYIPPVGMFFFTSAMSAAANNYDAITVHLEARTNGLVTARSAHQAAPLITLNQTIFF